MTKKIKFEKQILVILPQLSTQVTTIWIKKLFCWFNFLGKNLHLVGSTTLCSKSEVTQNNMQSQSKQTKFEGKIRRKLETIFRVHFLRQLLTIHITYVVHRTHVSRSFKSWNCHYKVLSCQSSNVPLKKGIRRYMLRFF